MIQPFVSPLKAKAFAFTLATAVPVAVAVAAAGFFASGALAQNRPFTAAEALKDIPPAGQACLREEVPIQANLVNKRAAAAPDMTCLVTAQELGLWVSAGQMVVVDTRRSQEYEQFHVNSALNLSASEVMHKAHLRSKAIVLVGNGKLERDLYAACADLKSKGFTSVKVLQGGMPAWLGAGQPVTGRAPDVALLRRLEPADLLAESQAEFGLTVLAPSELGLQAQLNSAVAAPKDSPEVLARLLEQRRKDTKGAGLNAVVLVTSPSTTPATLAQWQVAAGPLPLLVYQEGVAAFQNYLKEQKAVWLAQARGPKQLACGQ